MQGLLGNKNGNGGKKMIEVEELRMKLAESIAKNTAAGKTAAASTLDFSNYN